MEVRTGRSIRLYETADTTGFSRVVFQFQPKEQNSRDS